MPVISEALSGCYFLARNTPSRPSHNSVFWSASPPFYSLRVSEFLCLDLDSSLGSAHGHFSLSKYSCSSLFGLQHKKQCSSNILLQTLSKLISLCSHHLHLSNITYISHLPPHPGLRWFTRGHTWKIVIKFHLNQQFILFISLSCKQKLP